METTPRGTAVPPEKSPHTPDALRLPERRSVITYSFEFRGEEYRDYLPLDKPGSEELLREKARQALSALGAPADTPVEVCRLMSGGRPRPTERAYAFRHAGSIYAESVEVVPTDYDPGGLAARAMADKLLHDRLANALRVVHAPGETATRVFTRDGRPLREQAEAELSSSGARVNKGALEYGDVPLVVGRELREVSDVEGEAGRA